MKMKQVTTNARRRLGKTLVAAVALACMAGTAIAAEFKKEEWVLVASVINTTNPYMASNIEGAKAMSKKLGIPLEIVNSNMDARRHSPHERPRRLP